MRAQSGLVHASKKWVVSALAVGAALIHPAPGPAAAIDVVDPQPNIVVLMIDDYAASDHRILERLPAINSLFLQRGTEFVNYWGNNPLCCPGRANFLTGQYSHHHGVEVNDAKLLDDRATLATALDGVGYQTQICGKYLNRTQELTSKWPRGWDNAAIHDGGYYRYRLWANGTQESHASAPSDYSTDVFAQRCLAFMSSASADAPLFTLMTPVATHLGRDEFGRLDGQEPAPAPRHRGDPRCADIQAWRPANYNPASLTNKPAYMRQRPPLAAAFADGLPLTKRCEALLSVDDWLAGTVALLQSQGRFNDTLFVLTADNGMGWGAFRWLAKTSPHTAQIPLFVNWPAVSGPSLQENKDLIANVDVAPTLCEIGGCVLGPFANGHPVDGESFAGLIAPNEFSSVPQRDSFLLEQFGDVKTPRWRAIMTNERHSLGAQWLFIRYKTGERELYRLGRNPCYRWSGEPGAADPCMMSNLAPKWHAVRRMLNAELLAEW